MIPFEYVTAAEDLGPIAEELSKRDVVGLDIETTALQPMNGEIRLFALNYGDGRSYVIDLFRTRTLGPIKDVLHNPLQQTGKGHPIVVAQNLEFDQKWLLGKFGLELWPVFDTYRASQLIHNGRQMSHDLYALFRRELKLGGSEVGDYSTSDWSRPQLSEMQLRYSAEDVLHLLKLRLSLRDKLQRKGLFQAALIEFGAILPEAEMELNGFRLDQAMWLALAERNKAEAERRGEILRASLPHPNGQLSLPGMSTVINLNSTQQLLKSLHRLGVQQPEYDDRGKIVWEPLKSTAKMVLAMVAGEFPVVQQIIDYRKYSKRYQSFGPAYLRHIHPSTGRVHTSWYPFTGCGRYACLVAGSMVKTREGSVPIEKIRPGVEVWTHRGRWRKVTASLEKGIRGVYRVALGNGEAVICTGTHRLLTHVGDWISVDGLVSEYPEEAGRATNTVLFAGRGADPVRIEAIAPCGSAPVYDLTVDEDHSYECCGVFSHNSSDPNLQQIPRDPAFRDCFRPEAGWKLILCDYSQIELRLVAEYSRDPVLLDIYRRGLDAHKRTASFICNVPVDKVSKVQRQLSKPVNFGLCYGLGAMMLVRYAQADYSVSMTLKQARTFSRRYFKNYAYVKAWQQRMLSEGKRDKISRTGSGRLRYLEGEKVHNELLNCVDAATEALTTRGWVPGFDLRRDDVLLTKNADTGELEWQAMTDLRLFPNARGRFIEFRAKSFSAVTTPDHRWLTYDKSSRTDKCRTSEKLSLHGDHRIHRTGVYVGPDLEKFSDDFVRLCGWFLTDDHFHYAPRVRTPDRPIVRISQSQRGNPENVREIDLLLERLDEKAWRWGPCPPTAIVTWDLDIPISAQLHELFPQRTLTPEFLGFLSRRQAEILLEVMVAGDGCDRRMKKGKRSFYTKAKHRADMFQMLCVICGHASSSRERDMSKYRPRSPKLRNIPKQTTYWCVTVLRRDKVQIYRSHRTDFEGQVSVWCPVVPNTYFVARREGQVYITGNTPIQGSGADGLKSALPIVRARLKKYGSDVKMVHMVHDEIVLEGRDDPELLEAAKTDLEQGMIEGMQPFLKLVPVVAEAAIGDSWADKE